MAISFEQDERLSRADEAFEALLDRYQVDLCCDDIGDYFFALREHRTPELKIVSHD